MRRREIGFIFQSFALLPLLTAWENVELTLRMAGVPRAEWKERTARCLDLVGLAKRASHRPFELSGGEQQRVAIAIALANRPSLILADEPTGSVDSATGEQILGVFRRLNREMGVTIVIVTHDLSVADKVDRVVAIRDGLTSTEWVKRDGSAAEAAGADPASSSVTRSPASPFGACHDEYVVIDRSGRLQIPKTYLEAMNVEGKAVLAFDGKRVLIGPPEDAPEESAEAGGERIHGTGRGRSG